MFGIFNTVFRTATRVTPHKIDHSPELRKIRDEQRRRNLEEDLRYQLQRPKL